MASVGLAFGMTPTTNLRPASCVPPSGLGMHAPPALWSSVPRRQGLVGRLSHTLRAKETVEEEAARRGGGRGTKGLYVRPSKALEVGGGFYVPGLEGYRLRLAIVGLIVTLLTLNRLLLPGYEPLPNQVVSETITALTATFVLVQALFDAAFKGGAAAEDDDGATPAVEAAPAAGAVAAGSVYVDTSASAESRDRLQWLVAAALQTVPAGSSVVVVGTRSRVAAAGAGAAAPSAAQV
jgi:hypothetical protein